MLTTAFAERLSLENSSNEDAKYPHFLPNRYKNVLSTELSSNNKVRSKQLLIIQRKAK